LLVPDRSTKEAENERIARSIHVAAAFARRLRERDAPIRTAFVEAQRRTDPDPRLAEILRGNRGGGGVRLKLELSILWIAVGEGHEVRYPLRLWAELLGLDNENGRGARRVANAFAWLEDAGLVRGERKPGVETAYWPMEETRRKRDYTIPGARITSTEDESERRQHRYVKLPAEMWTSGWIADLSGAAIAMLLILLTQAWPNADREIWFSPSFADERFRLSEDTRRRGLRELEGADLIRLRRRALESNTLTNPRLRNVYQLQLDRLSRKANE
jgi:hypothetical protein